MIRYGTSEEYDHGWEDGYAEANRQRRKNPHRPTKRKALRIVRLLAKAYEAGDADDTLAWLLQNEMEKEK
jgi:hypothetical protein